MSPQLPPYQGFTVQHVATASRHDDTEMAAKFNASIATAIGTSPSIAEQPSRKLATVTIPITGNVVCFPNDYFELGGEQERQAKGRARCPARCL